MSAKAVFFYGKPIECHRIGYSWRLDTTDYVVVRGGEPPIKPPAGANQSHQLG